MLISTKGEEQEEEEEDDDDDDDAQLMLLICSQYLLTFRLCGPETTSIFGYLFI